MAETQEQDILSKKIKHSLENWREIVILIRDVLLWTNFPLYPGIVFGVSTLVFIAIVLWDPTLLTFISSISLAILLADYVAPFLLPRVFDSQSWTSQKEKLLNETCSQLAATYTKLKSDICRLYSLKDTSPKLYYAVLITTLIFLSWLGNNVNNIFLTYVFVTSILMLPGLKQKGYLEKVCCMARSYIGQTANKKEKKQ